MINKLLLSLYLIVGVMLVVTMLIYSLDGESQIQDNREKAYLEHIERESVK